jgi:hypothetical protein
MIEAVNVAAASAPFLRGNAEQMDVANSFAANPERLQESLPQAPYVSPYIAWDLDQNKAVLQIRNGETGDVVRQFPSDTLVALQERRDIGQVETSSSAPAASGAPTPEAQANVAQAQVAAAALAKGAQAALPQISTVVTSA